jgi:uncharacterized protein
MALVHDIEDRSHQSMEDSSNAGSGNVQAVRRAYQAFASGDIPTVLAMLDDQVEWNMAEHHIFWPGEPFIGPQAVLEGVFVRIMQTFEGFGITVERIVGCADTVVAQVRYHATARATGRALEAQAAHIFDFLDGKCVRYQHYADTWQFAEVTGLAPEQYSTSSQ